MFSEISCCQLTFVQIDSLEEAYFLGIANYFLTSFCYSNCHVFSLIFIVLLYFSNSECWLFFILLCFSITEISIFRAEHF